MPQQRSASSIKCQGADVETAGAVKVLCLYFLQPQQEVDDKTPDATLWIALGGGMRQQIFVGFCHTQCTHQTVFDPLRDPADAAEFCVRHGEDLIAQET